MKKLFRAEKLSFLLVLILFGAAQTAFAQTTQFTYQGRFTDSTAVQPTNGTYEMQFKAFDAATNGNQFASTVTLPTVQVVNGIFTVSLDYGAQTFRGADVFLEIAARPAGSANAFTTLAPRQQFTSSPYAIQSFNARNATIANDSMNLGGFPANQYVQINDVRLTDDRNPLAGSANYVQNQNSAVQPTANFNISGTGAADSFNALTQFNIGGNRVLSVQGSVNLFAGVNAGTANTGGNSNTFVGNFSGNANINGTNNAFFGTDSGRNNQTNNNSFFGRSSGFANIGGANNSFFGLDSGRFNVAGNNNAFFGYSSGANNLSDSNSFFGYQAGVSNTTGSNNTMLGYNANVTANNLNFATAIGAGASVSTSNTIVLGTASISTEVPGTLKVFTLGAAGGTSLCRNAANQIATCTGGGAGGNFIQNSTVLQPSSDFNISGGGTLGGTLSANIVNSTTNFRIGNVAVFSTPNQTSVVAGQSSNFALLGSDSTFIGYKTGAAANSFSQANTFIGSNSGTTTTSGGNNSFVGKDAGLFNTSGSLNSFFGSGAGLSNTTAGANSFFGYESGKLNSTGTRNAFFGFQAGLSSATVNDNSFFGYQSGLATTGANNSFFGSLSGNANNSGSKNAFFGSSSGKVNNTGSDNAFFGNLSGSTNTSGSSNTFVGSQSGDTNTIGSDNTFVGFGAGGTLSSDSTVIGANAETLGDGNTTVGIGAFSKGNNNTNIGNGSSTNFGDFNTTIGYQARVRQFPGSNSPVTNSTAIGAGAVVDSDNTIVLGTSQEFVKIPGSLNVSSNVFASQVTASQLVITGGSLKMTTVQQATNTGNHLLCINGNGFLSRCPFSTSNDNLTGSTEVPNAQLETQTNQINVQQLQINQQAEQLKQQQETIDALKKFVCASNPTAAVCQK